MNPEFTYHDVHYAEPEAVFQRAVRLFTDGRVGNISEISDGFMAIVQGTQPYRVRVNYKRIDYADCDCYLGQNDQLCKHILALALAVLHREGVVDEWGRPTKLYQVDPTHARDHIRAGLRKVGAYNGPSRIWFEYQRKLDIGAAMIVEGVHGIPADLPGTKYLWSLVVKLSRKLSEGGVDDSNGTVGNAIFAIIERLAEIAVHDTKARDWLKQHATDDTGFGFEEDLQQRL